MAREEDQEEEVHDCHPLLVLQAPKHWVIIIGLVPKFKLRNSYQVNPVAPQSFIVVARIIRVLQSQASGVINQPQISVSQKNPSWRASGLLGRCVMGIILGMLVAWSGL